jgi:hypothetical protein
MRAPTYLKIAAVVAWVQAVLHTIGGVFGAPPPGPGEAAFAAMRENRFPVMGLMRSYRDFYLGFGLSITVSMLVEGAILWQLASLAKANPRGVRPLLVTFFVGYVLIAIDAAVFFFPPPVLGASLIALCVLLAILASRKQVEA